MIARNVSVSHELRRQDRGANEVIDIYSGTLIICLLEDHTNLHVIKKNYIINSDTKPYTKKWVKTA